MIWWHLRETNKIDTDPTPHNPQDPKVVLQLMLWYQTLCIHILTGGPPEDLVSNQLLYYDLGILWRESE